MKTPKNDTPKMPLVWFSTCRGVSNPDRYTNRLYYGRVLRIPQDIEDAKTERLAIEEREMRALEETVLGTSCVENGTPATGEILERYDVYDAETGDILIMYRVPYKASDDKKRHPAMSPHKSHDSYVVRRLRVPSNRAPGAISKVS